MNIKVRNTLENIGLNEKEISVYLACLETGPANMTRIAQKSGLKRPTAYLVYESLEKRGLMGSFKKSSGMQFFSKNPKTLLEKARQNFENIESILPELLAIENENINKPKITYYEGIENYKEVVEDTLRFPNSTLYMIGNIDPLFEILSKKYDEEYYIPERIKRNIHVKAILSSTTGDFVKTMPHKQEKREVKYLPTEAAIKSFSLIYGNKIVSMEISKDIFLTVIESETLARDEKVKFKLLWESLGAKNTPD